MKPLRRYLFFLTLVIVSVSCEKTKNTKTLIVKNNLNLSRSFETIEISRASLQLEAKDSLALFGIRDAATKVFLVTQYVDNDKDGILDAILFQPELDANAQKKFELVKLESPLGLDSINYCYSRFVPERTDDYAWENNRVAFRTYGPTAQIMIEDNVKGGTLSSGIDAWLKKVEYPIINAWYEKTTTGTGSYHNDTGEGLDNFHVGVSRGVGGITVKKDSVYYVSKNFISWETLTNGPIRTSFILKYANWDAAGNTITEEKRISLDYGTNLSKYEIIISGTDHLSVGLTLHENDGEITTKVDKGWISYWEPHEGSELGTAVVSPAASMTGYEYFVTPLTDQSNLYAHLAANDKKVTYYAGFSWKESGQFTTKNEWEQYLDDFAIKINNPLIVQIEK